MIEELAAGYRVRTLFAILKATNLRSRRFLVRLGFVSESSGSEFQYSVEPDEILMNREALQSTSGIIHAMKIRAFQQIDEPAVVALWQECGLTRPWNDPHADIARKLTEQPELFLVGTVDGELVATAMVGFDGHRGWVYYLAVSPGHRRRSYGRALMREAERLLIERGCPKLNLLLRASNAEVIGFYRKLGYMQDEVVGLGRRLIPDQPSNPGGTGRTGSGCDGKDGKPNRTARRR